jgi:hypothetical protein
MRRFAYGKVLLRDAEQSTDIDDCFWTVTKQSNEQEEVGPSSVDQAIGTEH